MRIRSIVGIRLTLVILRILTLLLLGTPLLIFWVYGFLLLYYYKRAKKSQYSETVNFEPAVSVVVPTHNEELIISKKIGNLLGSNYPREKLDLVFVDDSDDSTPRIISEYCRKFSNIRLIRFDKRMGYNACMIAGCRAAKGEIIILNDAGSFLDAFAISNLARHFRNSNIGAVTGRGVILNPNEATGRLETTYLKLSDFMRIAETEMDSTFHFNGEASAVRKNLIADLDSCDATFDTAVALFIRQKGYKTIYDPQVKFYEYSPLTHSERIKQKTIRATNLITILLQFKKMIFKREYGKYGSIILPMNLAMLMIVPIAILAGTVLLTILTLFDPAFASIVWSVVGIFFLFLLVFSRETAFTFLEFEYSLLKALCQVIVRKRTYDTIEKIISTRRHPRVQYWEARKK